jgi:hypothetical protein
MRKEEFRYVHCQTIIVDKSNSDEWYHNVVRVKVFYNGGGSKDIEKKASPHKH